MTDPGRPTAHEQFAELAVGHALSALEPEDEQLFLAHLPGCAQCERDVAEHRETLSHLAYGVEAAEPPAALLTGIRDGVRRSARESSFPAPVSLAAARHRRLGRLAPRDLRRTAVGAGIAAAAALVVGLAAMNSSLQHDNKEQVAWGQRLASTVRVLEDTGSKSVPLAGAGKNVQAVAVLHGDAVSLVVDGLAPNDKQNSTYVLWEVSRFGDKRAVGTFDVSKSGLDVVRGLRLHSGPGAVQSLAVTHEASRTAPPLSTRPAVVAGNVT